MVYLTIVSNESMGAQIWQTFVAFQDQGLQARSLTMTTMQETEIDFLKDVLIILAESEILQNSSMFQSYISLSYLGHQVYAKLTCSRCQVYDIW